jgi:outer membrane protein insertion porin family
MTRTCLALLLIFWLGSASELFAVRIEDLDLTRSWRLRELDITGDDKLKRSDVTAALLTQTRPWYRFWADYPVFDAVSFRADLERVRRLYESRGFYHAEVDYDLTVDPEDALVSGRIIIREGAPVIVAEVDVSVTQNPTLPERLPIATGDVFSEDAYLRSEAFLKQFYGEQGYAYVESERKAEIVLDSNQAFLNYRIEPGPPSTFGATEVIGVQDVAPDIIRRELAYQAGDRYSPSKIAETRDRLLALDLFGMVDIGPDKSAGKSAVVPMQVQVSEKEAREIRLGVGYGSEDRFRTQLEWRNNNWLGDGRRLSILTKYSLLESSGVLNFIQPHLFSPAARGIISLRHDQTDEETYLLRATRFNPRLEYRFNDHLSGFFGYRLEHDHFTEVDRATVNAVGGVEKKGLISGPILGLAWNSTDNPLNPSRGEILSFSADQAGAPWGGRYHFYHLGGEGKKYWSIGWETIFAARLKLGFADALGSTENLPLSERLYAGGEKSVRGYGRRKLGPRSADNDPIGGLSLLEGSMELRRPLWQALGGALFVDFGQVSRRAFDVPVGNVKFAAGFGLSYSTPVGPVRVDIGFPFSPPRGDQAFQVHFSIGAAF